MTKPIKVLNLHAGVGGNRKKWDNVEVTAVELEPEIAAIYQKLFPNDKVVVGDADDYLLDNYSQFDFIWASPPCQTHSKMMKATRHQKKRFTDMRLYQYIIFLQHFFKGKWVVENVEPYYEPLIKPSAVLGRHLFWTNFDLSYFYVPQPKGFINKANLEGKKDMMNWLGIHFDEVVYYKDNHCPVQILRNCVHPDLGLHVFRESQRVGMFQF